LIKVINMKKSPDTIYCTVGSGEACARLGISRDTLYAYVSRGLVRTVAHPSDARKSLYDRRDVDALMQRKGRGRSRRAVAESTIDWGEPVLSSKITHIADGTFFYRGHNAVELSETQSLEDTLRLLARVRCKPSADAAMLATPHQRPFERILAGMALLATADAAGDGRPRAGHIMSLTAQWAAGAADAGPEPIHRLLARHWSTDAGAEDIVRRALVLCADHELNASAYAARVAASAGASLAASLLAGLATLSGGLHGGLTPRCRRWMDQVDTGASPVPDSGDPPPGFGHPLYPDGDPRAAELLRCAPLTPRWQRLLDDIRTATNSHPTLDFALAHLERRFGLPEGAGLGMFAVGRTAGWLAHIFEQRETGKLIRPRAASE